MRKAAIGMRKSKHQFQRDGRVHESVENSREIIRTVLSAPNTFAVVLKQNTGAHWQYQFNDRSSVI